MALDVQEETPPVTSEKKTRRTRYKAEIAFVSPQSARHTFDEISSCFLGVSLENGNFTTAKLDSMVKWISRRFSRCTVLIGDSIHRLTLESMYGLAPDEAHRRAIGLGRQFLAQERPVFEAYRDSTEFTFVTCGDVQGQVECGEVHDQLCKLFADDEAFRGSVESFARAYHAKRSAEVSGRTGATCRDIVLLLPGGVLHIRLPEATGAARPRGYGAAAEPRTGSLMPVRPAGPGDPLRAGCCCRTGTAPSLRAAPDRSGRWDEWNSSWSCGTGPSSGR
ncbi:tRNA-dependent cyclodipeptide synthase [Streptomyces fradiae]|uniref:tRNA-dependent cyclodipeptide synthase n=1 Tax=Streptomyces fradiae TaxID=1906 RepID=UPI0037F9EDA0